jgi:hypothetical protein
MKGSTMGWFTEGSNHEGYVVCVFADGMYGAGGKHRQIHLLAPDGKTIWADDNVMDQLWTRVWDPADEDHARHRIYAGDPSSDDAAYVSDRGDLEPLFIDQWHRHIAPDLHVHTISTLGDQLKNIESQLDNAVAAARADGLSWDKIGRAFGITRQGARKRWDKQSASKEE